LGHCSRSPRSATQRPVDVGDDVLSPLVLTPSLLLGRALAPGGSGDGFSDATALEHLADLQDDGFRPRVLSTLAGVGRALLLLHPVLFVNLSPAAVAGGR
jgi:hypothetical protein